MSMTPEESGWWRWLVVGAGGQKIESFGRDTKQILNKSDPKLNIISSLIKL